MWLLSNSRVAYDHRTQLKSFTKIAATLQKLRLLRIYTPPYRGFPPPTQQMNIRNKNQLGWATNYLHRYLPVMILIFFVYGIVLNNYLGITTKKNRTDQSWGVPKGYAPPQNTPPNGLGTPPAMIGPFIFARYAQNNY